STVFVSTVVSLRGWPSAAGTRRTSLLYSAMPGTWPFPWRTILNATSFGYSRVHDRPQPKRNEENKKKSVRTAEGAPRFVGVPEAKAARLPSILPRSRPEMPSVRWLQHPVPWLSSCQLVRPLAAGRENPASSLSLCAIGISSFPPSTEASGRFRGAHIPLLHGAGRLSDSPSGAL